MYNTGGQTYFWATYRWFAISIGACCCWSLGLDDDDEFSWDDNDFSWDDSDFSWDDNDFSWDDNNDESRKSLALRSDNIHIPPAPLEDASFKTQRLLLLLVTLFW